MRPISASGWRTVVSAGVTIAACSESSKPTIERSSGTRSPRSRAARSAPIAMLSLNAKIAVGGSASVEQPRGGLRAALDARSSPSSIELRVGQRRRPPASAAW